ncbi:hypothetical protein LCGC14_1048670 [marine sediment metagenome]|uniref:Alanine--tRNA ligase n=1 Tax=marine sediment metagenome TaxID=412755 RepID=A0A0F9NBB1_9ZZZZ
MLTKAQIKILSRCKNDKEIKKAFKIIASKEPDNYFPTNELEKLGYIRKHCESCSTYFWTTLKERKVCGDPMCSGGFQVTFNNPSKVKLSYVGVWKKIVEILEPRGYVPIKRYPCVARWNPTSEFTIASISAFQPYVVSGEVEPPAKKLMIPQFCLRFNDIENVGVTFSHNTGFVMIGVHAFLSPEEWNQGELFKDMHDFIHEGVGLPKEEITIHEDSWAGGGSFGCSLEFFSRGVELFNQVYTMYEQTPEGPRELKLKVLDMGLGQERVAWFSQGTPNMYEAIFPSVLAKLRERTNIQLDLDLYNKFSQFSAYLNIDEVEDMDKAWEKVAEELKMEVSKLRETILPMTGLYSIADHARSLLFAINDGKLPSNVGGGYNLRVIFRRAINFIDKFKWDISIADVCKWHAEELHELFPEVSEHLDEIREILSFEKKKFYATKKKAGKILDRRMMKKEVISTNTLIELYDSNGISPDMVKTTAKKYGVKVKIPDDFYSLVVQRHEKSEQVHATEKKIELDLEGIPETKSLYYNDYTKFFNEANVLKIKDKMVVMDKSVAYPTSGGQLHDVGKINGQEFNDVFKQGNYIVHVLDEIPNFKEGDVVKIEVDEKWRKQLSQHHTATHIVNAAARLILGNHINQAGAKKTLKRSSLDLTHYKQIKSEILLDIEKKANKIVEKGIPLNLSFIPRSEAEQKYGMGIYQGGAVPGKKLRIVEIPNIDVEACGGTHLNLTSEVGKIKIIKSQKIKDDIVRLIFTAGEATFELEEKYKKTLTELESFLNVDSKLLVGRVKELLDKRNRLMHKVKKVVNDDLELKSQNLFKGDVLTELSRILRVNKEKVSSKIKNLYSQWEQSKESLNLRHWLLSDENVNDLKNNAKFLLGNPKYRIVIEELDLPKKDLQKVSTNIFKSSKDMVAAYVSKRKKGIEVAVMLGPGPLKESDYSAYNMVMDCVNHFDSHGKGGGTKSYSTGLIIDGSVDKSQVKKYLEDEYYTY